MVKSGTAAKSVESRESRILIFVEGCSDNITVKKIASILKVPVDIREMRDWRASKISKWISEVCDEYDKIIVLRDKKSPQDVQQWFLRIAANLNGECKRKCRLATAENTIESWILALMSLHPNPDALSDPERELDHQMQLKYGRKYHKCRTSKILQNLSLNSIKV